MNEKIPWCGEFYTIQFNCKGVGKRFDGTSVAKRGFPSMERGKKREESSIYRVSESSIRMALIQYPLSLRSTCQGPQVRVARPLKAALYGKTGQGSTRIQINRPSYINAPEIAAARST